MSAADERAWCLRAAETEPEDVAALAAALIGHTRLSDPSNRAGWICGCLHQGRLGEMFHRHVAEELLALQRRRAGATT